MANIRIQRVGKPIQKLPSFENIIFEAVFSEARTVKEEFERTVSTWKEKPTFRLVKVSKFGYDVETNNPIYGYVDEGTRPHIIRPKKAKALRFNTSGFKPKTSPRTLVSGSGSPAKPPTAFSQEVHHPGTQARNYTERIAAKSRKRFAKAMQQALKRVK